MIKKVLFVVCICALTVASFTLASEYLVAQQNTDPSKIASQDASANNLKGFKNISEEDLIARAFPNNKETCGKKAGIFLAVAKQYKDGEDIEEMVSMSMIRPIFEEPYERIKKEGITKAYINDIKGYKSCVRSSSSHKDAKKERALQVKHRSCVKFADAVLKTLKGIDAGKSMDTIMKPYENGGFELKGTAFEGMDHPVLFLIGQIYGTAQSKSYDDAVSMGHSLLVACSA